MADKLKNYTVTIGGIEHTLQLTDEDAERYGDAATLVKAARVSNKAATADANAAAGADGTK